MYQNWANEHRVEGTDRFLPYDGLETVECSPVQRLVHILHLKSDLWKTKYESTEI